jgi:hypothetical protein
LCDIIRYGRDGNFPVPLKALGVSVVEGGLFDESEERGVAKAFASGTIGPEMNKKVVPSLLVRLYLDGRVDRVRRLISA